MQVSFVIPLYNCLPLTQAMLASLQATVPPGLAHEIIFVDDHSTDGTRVWLAGLGAIPAMEPEKDSAPAAAPIRVILNHQNLGFAATCNRGAAAATGSVLVFLNNDLVLLPGWLPPMLRLARAAHAGLVGNIQLNHATGAIDHAGVVFTRQGKPAHVTRISLLATFIGRQPVAALTGACFAIARTTWNHLGGFDEGFVNGGEDVDLCLRARQAGHRNTVATRSVVRHHISQSPGRKQRDEANSRRLLTRWRREIAALAAGDFCQACLEVAWTDPRDYPDPVLARDAFLLRYHLALRPTHRLLAAVNQSFEVEFHRWAQLLDAGAPPPDTRTVAWQLFPVPPEHPPVL